MRKIDTMSEEEIKSLVEELREYGYQVTMNSKGAIIRSEAEKLGMHNPFICSDLRKAITTIADRLLDNTNRTGIAKKRGVVAGEIYDEYRHLVSGILSVMKPYYGRLGFTSRKFVDNEEVES